MTDYRTSLKIVIIRLVRIIHLADYKHNDLSLLLHGGIMSFDPDLTPTKRAMRSEWALEEQDISEQSAQYAKSHMSFFDYIRNITYAGHDIKVFFNNDSVTGTIVEIGSDYFCVRQNNSTIKHIFSIGKSDSNFMPKYSIEILEASKENLIYIDTDRSFRYLLEDISNQERVCTITLNSSLETIGTLNVLKDCIEIFRKETNQKRLVTKGTSLAPFNTIVSLSLPE